MAKKNKIKLADNIFWRTLLFYKKNFWVFTKIAIIVVLISAVIKSYDLTHTNSSDLALILYIAGIYVLLALVWLNFNKKQGEKIKIASIYKSSSARFFPFLAVSLVQSAMSLPLVIGGAIIILTIGLGVTPIFILVGVVFMIVSIVLLVWYSMAGLIIVEESEITSVKALAKSKKLIKGSFWWLVVRYLVFILAIVLFSGVIINFVTSITFVSDNWFIKGIIDGLLATLILSVLTIFAYNLYEDLKKRDRRPSKKKN